MMRRTTFTKEQDRTLADVYVEVKVPSDSLPFDMDAQRLFMERYRTRTGDNAHTGKEVVSRLITLRKNRMLPRLEN